LYLYYVYILFVWEKCQFFKPTAVNENLFVFELMFGYFRCRIFIRAFNNSLDSAKIYDILNISAIN